MHRGKFSIMKIIFLLLLFTSFLEATQNKKLVYIVSDVRIPFWEIMSRGMKTQANSLAYEFDIYSADNIKKIELENTVRAIKDGVDGIIISPITSSSAATVLKLAKKANIPVVIADIGAQSKDYISFISSNNFQGAYELGKTLTKKMQELHWQDGSVGIVAIPQKRANGKARTNGFMKALDEAGIKSATLKQQKTFSCEETYNYSMQMLQENPNLRAIWLQGSDRYKAALKAIEDSGRKGKVLLICFDAEPIFLELIPKGILVAAAMQQPYLMGKKSVEILDRYLHSESVPKNIAMDILLIDQENIEEKMPIIQKNVLGIED